MSERGQRFPAERAGRLRELLAADPRLPMGAAAEALGMSRAALYRRFPTRADLLAALDVPGGDETRERLVRAAAELLEEHGADGLGVEEAAARAGVPRATAYRHFPGREPLLAAVVHAGAPHSAVAAVLAAHHDTPLEDLVHALAGALLEHFAQRPQFLRALLYEASGSGPAAVTVGGVLARDVVGPVAAALGGRLRAAGRGDVHPVVAAQALAGPLVLHALSREVLTGAGLDVPPRAAVARTVAGLWLHGTLGRGGPDGPAPREP
ncbi:hypothetical protein NUM3379_01690 [Kineococcus sp. NUM-3379]